MSHSSNAALAEMKAQYHTDQLKDYKQSNNLTSTLVPEPTADIQEKLTPKPINVGFVTEIKQISSKYGKSFQIVMDHGSFIYNCQTVDYVHQLFKVGQKTAFSYKEKKSADGSKTYKVINDLFLTF